MQQDNRRSPARPLSALPITERTQSYPPAAKDTPAFPTARCAAHRSLNRTRRFAPTVQNATKCNVMQQQNQISPPRPLDAWAITDRTQSSPPAAKGTPLPPPHGARGIEVRKRTRRFAPTRNVTKCNTKSRSWNVVTDIFGISCRK